MYLNEHTSLSGPALILVPYCAHHVPRYHEWMQDPELQAATASEPLSIEEEYAMQKSWRTDRDKLTFIICKKATDQDDKQGKRPDAEADMIGDINLFLSVEDVESASDAAQPNRTTIAAEIELMIADKVSRRKGYGREALLMFLSYVIQSSPKILQEYEAGAMPPGKSEGHYIRVKINESNQASLALFESLGFERVTDTANYFGELELRLHDTDAILRQAPSIQTHRYDTGALI